MKETPDYSNYIIKPIIFNGIRIIPPEYFTRLPYFFLAEDSEIVECSEIAERKSNNVYFSSIIAYAKEPLVMFETRYKIMWSTRLEDIIQSLIEIEIERDALPSRQTLCYTWDTALSCFVEINKEQIAKIDMFKEPV